MNLPIICFDMDGTLLNEQGRIHPSDVALLASPQPPALFIPCTGRPLHSIRCGFARNGLYSAQPIPLHMVLQNGALRLAPHERLLALNAFEPGVQKELLALATRFPGVMSLFLDSSEIYLLYSNPFGLQLSSGFDFDLRPLSEADPAASFTKVMCMSDSRSALDAIAAIVASWPVESAFSMPVLLEITNKNVNKATGIMALLQGIGMSDQPLYAAGDGENDLPIFRIAAASFAPVTAPDAIKSAATHIIDVSQNGLLAPILDLIA